MTKLKLTVACDDYDFLQPLRDGKVKVDGIDLNLLTVESGIRHYRMNNYGEYEASEFSFGSYIVARSQGIDWLQALPFFLRRMFCHRFLFIRAGSGIRKPSDLKGRRIGMLGYQNSLGLIVKGMMMNTYGLPVTDATWVTVREERINSTVPASIRIERAPEGRSLEELLLSGEIDCLAEPDLPKAWLAGEGTVERLFPDYEQEERDYYKKTGIFPLMHPLVVKKDILDRDPWVATSLFEAFIESRRLHNEFMQQPHRLSFAWPQVEQERAIFGKDPFYQGLRANRHDIDSMIQFAAQQGMLAGPVTADELFPLNMRLT